MFIFLCKNCRSLNLSCFQSYEIPNGHIIDDIGNYNYLFFYLSCIIYKRSSGGCLYRDHVDVDNIDKLISEEKIAFGNRGYLVRSITNIDYSLLKCPDSSTLHCTKCNGEVITKYFPYGVPEGIKSKYSDIITCNEIIRKNSIRKDKEEILFEEDVKIIINNNLNKIDLASLTTQALLELLSFIE